MTLRCYCCGEEYERGRYRCCAPAKNMSPDKWLAKHCKKCSGDPTGLRTKCPNHCTCPKDAAGATEDFGTFRESLATLLKQLEREQKTVEYLNWPVP